jgi:hypothetical protein
MVLVSPNRYKLRQLPQGSANKAPPAEFEVTPIVLQLAGNKSIQHQEPEVPA